MLFNSLTFICLFLPVVAVGFFVLGRTSALAAEVWLCASSLFFYGWWSPAYVWLLLASVAYNYSAGWLIRRSAERHRRLVLGVAIAGDLALLGYYKYTNFFVDSANHLLGTDWVMAQIILPLGISFFTFTQIAYLADTFQGKAREYHPIRYLLFVTYFPHLIAGPILHHAQMMPQFAEAKTYRLDWRNIAVGVTIFIIGLAKKVLLADMFAVPAAGVFGAASHGVEPMLIEAWIGALAYTLQLYFDFSGYTDMAIGISYIFNIRLPLNFNSPYKATSIVDFWRRWHMTLSAFLRDYLYIPLGGNRHGPARRYFNLMATMLLGGLWHGAGWTFVVWGGLHGLYLVINHGFHAFRRKVGWDDGHFGRTGHVVSVGVTFLAVVVAWVFFRANDFSTAGVMIRGMCGLNGVSLMNEPGPFSEAAVHFLEAHGVVFQGFTPILLFTGPLIVKLILGLLIVWFMPNTQEWMNLPDLTPKLRETVARFPGVWAPEGRWTWAALGLLGAFGVLAIMTGAPSPFLYFQF